MAQQAQVLDSLSPLKVLERGYTILSKASGEVIKDAASVSAGDSVQARLARGQLELIVDKVAKDIDGQASRE